MLSFETLKKFFGWYLKEAEKKMYSPYCNGYGNDQYGYGPGIDDNTPYWDKWDTVAALNPQYTSNNQHGQPELTNSANGLPSPLDHNHSNSEGIKLLDISFRRLSPIPLEAIQLSVKDKELDLTAEEFKRCLNDLNGNESDSDSSSDMEVDEENKDDSPASSSLKPKKEGETRGRKRLYNDEQRKSRRKTTVKESFERCAERKRNYRQELFAEVHQLEDERDLHIQTFKRLLNVYKSLNTSSMSDADKNRAKTCIQESIAKLAECKINIE